MKESGLTYLILGIKYDFVYVYICIELAKLTPEELRK